MLITVAGAQYLLRTSNGLSSLQLGTDGRFFVRPKLGHRSLGLLTVRSSRGLSSNPGNAVKNSQLHGNEKPRKPNALSSSSSAVSPSSEASSMGSGGTVSPPLILPEETLSLEERIEMVIFNCRFLTLFAVVGSLAGSVLCFLKGGVYVFDSFKEWYSCFLHQHATSKVILLLVEALDVYLMGTVMLIFGMGLYGLFISSLDVSAENSGAQDSGTVFGSNLFGLFKLQERPKWLNIQSLEELKAKLGHVIVMVLLVGMFDKKPLQRFQSPQQDKMHNDNTSPQSSLRRSPRLKGSFTEVPFHVPLDSSPTPKKDHNNEKNMYTSDETLDSSPCAVSQNKVKKHVKRTKIIPT